jgi:hypothetical protein
MRRKKKLQDAEEQQQRHNPAEDFGQPPADHLAGVLHARGVEILDELRILDARRVEIEPAVGFALVRAANRLIADEYFGDLSRAHACLNSLYEIWRPRGGHEPRLRQREQERRPRTYHTAPPGRPGASERLSLPVRLSRGFIPGGLRRLAMSLRRSGAADPKVGRYAAVLLPAFSNTSPLSPTVDRYAITLTENRSRARASRAGRGWRRWIARFNGRAPYIGSYPSLTLKMLGGRRLRST